MCELTLEKQLIGVKCKFRSVTNSVHSLSMFCVNYSLVNSIQMSSVSTLEEKVHVRM
jgi:hypothetical protein